MNWTNITVKREYECVYYPVFVYWTVIYFSVKCWLLLFAVICIDHGRRSVGGQWDIPLIFEVEGTPCVLSPYFIGGWHFCTNAHGIHWIIGAIFVKFGQLILIKITEIVAIWCQILSLKCTKFNFGWGSNDPAGELTALPQTP